MRYDEIVPALNSALAAFPDLTPKYSLLGGVNSAGFNGQPDPLDTYMTCHLMTVDFQALDVACDGSYEVYRGIFQIDIYVPSGSGSYQASVIAQSLKDYFDRDIPLVSGTTSIRVERAVFNPNGITEGAHTMYPVSIYFNSLS